MRSIERYTGNPLRVAVIPGLEPNGSPVRAFCRAGKWAFWPAFR